MKSKTSKSSSGKGALLESVYSYLSLFFLNEHDEIRTKRILEAMNIIDRKYFVDPAGAYVDAPVMIGEGQTSSQPSTVARMLFLADLKQKDKVLEVGSASGWTACLASFLVHPGRVVSIELIPSLNRKSVANWKSLRKDLKKTDSKKVDNIDFRLENLFDLARDAEEAFDKIIITAGITLNQEIKIKDIAIKMLKSNGILICPYTSGPMLILKKVEGDIIKDYTGEDYAFVPLIEDD
jgi:protein-L-isoaspartate(D-aspartate) O-methyltransferase